MALNFFLLALCIAGILIIAGLALCAAIAESRDIEWDYKYDEGLKNRFRRINEITS